MVRLLKKHIRLIIDNIGVDVKGNHWSMLAITPQYSDTGKLEHIGINDAQLYPAILIAGGDTYRRERRNSDIECRIELIAFERVFGEQQFFENYCNSNMSQSELEVAYNNFLLQQQDYLTSVIDTVINILTDNVPIPAGYKGFQYSWVEKRNIEIDEYSVLQDMPLVIRHLTRTYGLIGGGYEVTFTRAKQAACLPVCGLPNYKCIYPLLVKDCNAKYVLNSCQNDVPLCDNSTIINKANFKLPVPKYKYVMSLLFKWRSATDEAQTALEVQILGFLGVTKDTACVVQQGSKFVVQYKNQ